MLKPLVDHCLVDHCNKEMNIRGYCELYINRFIRYRMSREKENNSYSQLNANPSLDFDIEIDVDSYNPMNESKCQFFNLYDVKISYAFNYIINWLKNKQHEVSVTQDLLDSDRPKWIKIFDTSIKSVRTHAEKLGINLLDLDTDIKLCNCCSREIKENPIEDKWGVGYICSSCQQQET